MPEGRERFYPGGGFHDPYRPGMFRIPRHPPGHHAPLHRPAGLASGPLFVLCGGIFGTLCPPAPPPRPAPSSGPTRPPARLNGTVLYKPPPPPIPTRTTEPNHQTNPPRLDYRFPPSSNGPLRSSRAWKEGGFFLSSRRHAPYCPG